MNEFFKKPVVKILMLKGEKGEKGDTGTGTPTGGKTGQYLQKKSDADYDYVWSPITTVSWDNVSGKPDAYPTTWDNVSGKQDATTSASGLMSAKDKSKLDNLQVGGRNLYLDTKSFNNPSVWKTYTSWTKKSETYNGLTVMANKGQLDGLYEEINAKEGEVYTFSAYVKNADGVLASIYIIYTTSTADISNEALPIPQSTDFVKYSLTFNILRDGKIRPRVECLSPNSEGKIEICGLKLERGNVATDWTPAPEDAENEIKALNSFTKSFTLSASSWSSGSYTISDSLITATSNQEIIPATSITTDQMKALQKANIIDSGQSAGSLTLKALGTVPTIDIPIRVIFRGTI